MLSRFGCNQISLHKAHQQTSHKRGHFVIQDTNERSWVLRVYVLQGNFRGITYSGNKRIIQPTANFLVVGTTKGGFRQCKKFNNKTDSMSQWIQERQSNRMEYRVCQHGVVVCNTLLGSHQMKGDECISSMLGIL
jgi:hypothetical protein